MALPDFTSQTDASEYKGNIDESIASLSGIVMPFTVRQADTPNMTVVVEAGRIQTDDAIVDVAQQTSLPLSIPTSNSRIDRIGIDGHTGALVVLPGAQSANPVAKSIPFGVIPLAQVLVTASTTSISDADITDERLLFRTTNRYHHKFGFILDTTGGTSAQNNIPSWVKKIVITLWNVGPGDLVIVLGTSSGWETSGYISRTGGPNAAESNTDNFIVSNGGTSVAGEIVLTNIIDNTWVMSGSLINGSSANWTCGGMKALADRLESIDLYTEDSSGSFDNGAILYEFFG